jgi:hypothetical protein
VVLPNLLVIGAMKAGTTSLHYYLSLHPEIFMSEEKEPTFFTVEKNWHKGLEWYESHFPVEARVRGESSPDYTKFPAIADVAARIHSVLPDARLIYLVRDPIERIISHYLDAYSFGRVNGTLDEELKDIEQNHFVNCSRYYFQLEQYLEHFAPRQILVLVSEDLRDDRASTMRNAFRFLGVDDSFSSPEWEKLLYTGEQLRRKKRFGYGLLRLSDMVRSSRIRPYLSRRLMTPIHAFNRLTAAPIARPQLSQHVRLELTEYLGSDVRRLREFTGLRFEKWSV